MDLRRLIQNTDCQLVRGDALTEVTALCCDSRCAGPGALFVCLFMGAYGWLGGVVTQNPSAAPCRAENYCRVICRSNWTRFCT